MITIFTYKKYGLIDNYYNSFAIRSIFSQEKDKKFLFTQQLRTKKQDYVCC